MQTFLPYADFSLTMKCLDPSRLGNQIYREGLTILRGGWKNHPASKMWRGHFGLLAEYCLYGIEELKSRGTDYDHWRNVFYMYMRKYSDQCGFPTWLGCEPFHSAHRAALLAKDFEWYSRFGWSEQPKIEYIWPICCCQKSLSK